MRSTEPDSHARRPGARRAVHGADQFAIAYMPYKFLLTASDRHDAIRRLSAIAARCSGRNGGTSSTSTSRRRGAADAHETGAVWIAAARSVRRAARRGAAARPRGATSGRSAPNILRCRRSGRDRLRPGAQSATSIRLASSPTSSSRCSATTRWRGRPGCVPLTADGDARGVGRLPHLDHAAPARHPLRRRPGVRGAGRASWSPPTTSTRSSASSTRPSCARPTARCRRQAWSGSRRCAKRPCATRRRSTTTRRSKACGRSTATRSHSGSRSRGRASSTSSPRRPTARWRARWSSPTARTSWPTRSAPAPTGSRVAAQLAHRARAQPRPTARPFDAEPDADDAEGQAWVRRFKGRRLPLNDGVEIAVIEESQPRWLSFLNGQVDFLARAARLRRPRGARTACSRPTWRKQRRSHAALR